MSKLEKRILRLSKKHTAREIARELNRPRKEIQGIIASRKRRNRIVTAGISGLAAIAAVIGLSYLSKDEYPQQMESYAPPKVAVSPYESMIQQFSDLIAKIGSTPSMIGIIDEPYDLEKSKKRDIANRKRLEGCFRAVNSYTTNPSLENLDAAIEYMEDNQELVAESRFISEMYKLFKYSSRVTHNYRNHKAKILEHLDQNWEDVYEQIRVAYERGGFISLTDGRINIKFVDDPKRKEKLEFFQDILNGNFDGYEEKLQLFKTGNCYLNEIYLPDAIRIFVLGSKIASLPQHYLASNPFLRQGVEETKKALAGFRQQFTFSIDFTYDPRLYLRGITDFEDIVAGFHTHPMHPKKRPGPSSGDYPMALFTGAKLIFDLTENGFDVWEYRVKGDAVKIRSYKKG